MTKPKHQLQKRATYASDSRKVKKTFLCVEQCTAFLIKSLFKFVTLRPGVFLAENTSCETDFSVGFTPSYLIVLCCAGGPGALLLLLPNTLPFLFKIRDESPSCDWHSCKSEKPPQQKDSRFC